jgi:chromosome segregation ATPase
MTASARSGDLTELRSAAAQLNLAERHFNDARARSTNDPVLRLVGGVPRAGRQLAASTHLAAIGADMSRAGEGAAEVAIQVAALKQKYAGRTLTADDLEAALQEAQGIAQTYKASIQAISQQLRAAHAERAQVDTTGLVGPLKDAYDAVDGALAEADTSFRRYQDVRQVLSDFLGVRLPA